MLLAEIGMKVARGAFIGGALGLLLFRRHSLKLHCLVYGSAFGFGMSWNNIYSYYKILNDSNTGNFIFKYCF